jgi:hypothetical protein
VVFPTSAPKDRGKLSGPPSRNDQLGEKFSTDINSQQQQQVIRSNNGRPGSSDDESKNIMDFGGGQSKPLSKDVNAVFSKVGSQTTGETGTSDAHPLLGITPAAPGEAFDFNPILSNPAVTRILAGSSGRIPQWEPTLPDLHGNSLMNMLLRTHHS